MSDVTVTQMNGWFKDIFGEYVDQVPEEFLLQREIKFSQKDKQGEKFTFPVRVRRAQGATYAGGSLYGTAYALNEPVAGSTREASQTSTSFVLRENIAYDALATAGGTKEAFGALMGEVIADMKNSAMFHQEMTLLYGGTDIGTISADPGAPAGGQIDVVLTATTWAAGLWSQAEGMKVDIYSAAGGTKRNTNASPDEPFVVSVVDHDARTITLTSSTDADMTAIAINDVIIPYGADGEWFDGLNALITNVSAHGISGATYGLWKAAAYSAGSTALTMAKVTALAARVMTKAGAGELDVCVPIWAWSDLNDSHAALRRFAESTKAGLDLGTSKITYFGPNGRLNIKPHIMIKAGEAFVKRPGVLKRIGASDTTFRLPNAPAGQAEAFLRELEDKAGVQVRVYWNNCLVTNRRAALAKVTDITNTSL